MDPSAAPQPSLRSGALWVVAGRVIGIAITLASNILAARVLGPAQFGVFLLFSAVVACGATLAMAGLNEAGLRFTAGSLGLGKPHLARAYLRRVASLMLATCLLACALTAAGLAVFQLVTGKLENPWLLGSLALAAIVALAWQQLAAELLRGWHELRLASLFSGGQTGGPVSHSLFIGALIAAAWVTPHVNATWTVGLLAASIAATAPLALIGLAWTARRSKPAAGFARPLTSEQSRELISVAAALLGIQLLSFVTMQFDIWIGGALLTDEQLGLYGAAKRSMLLAAMPVQVASLAVVGSIPRLHVQNRPAELERVLRGSALLAAIPSLAALAGLMLFPQAVLQLVFGESYAGAVPLMLVLGGGQLVFILTGNPIHTLAMTGHHRVAFVVNLLGAFILVVGGWLATRAFGALGLAVASAASWGIQHGLLWWLARRYVGVWTHVGLAQRLALWPPLSQQAPPTRTTMESAPSLIAQHAEPDLAPFRS